jgi:hypothetical protein
MVTKTLSELYGTPNQDLYLFPANRVDLQQLIANNAKVSGREAIEFETVIGTTKLIGVAVGKRKNAGQTAKTVRQFAHAE